MDPAAISTGMGEGMAQVFKPQEDFLGEAMKAAQAKKKESAANKAKALEMLNKEYHIWTERDGAEFAKKQKELWDGLSGRDLDTAETMLWLNQKQQELTYLADRSNQDRELYKGATNLYATKPTKYLDETLTNLQEFASPDNALGVKKSWNPAYMVERADLDTDLKKLADLGLSRANANKQKLASVRTIPGSTEPYTVETTTTEYSLPEAEQDIRIQMQEPSWRKTVNERWQTDPNRDKYKTVDEYAQFELAPKIASKSYLEDATRVPTREASGRAGISSPYGLTNISTETAAVSPEEIVKNPELASVVTSNEEFKKAYNNYKQSWQSSTPEARLAQGLGDRMATAEEYAANVLQKEGKIIPISRLNPTGEPMQAREILFETGKGKNTPAILQGFFDYNGKLMVQAGVEAQKAQFGKPAVYETKYFPLTSTNYKKIVNEYSDPKAEKSIEDYLIENGYGEQIKQFKVKPQASSGTTTASGTTTGGAKATSNVKRDAAGNTYGGTQPAAPIQGKATGSVLKDYAPDVQARIKAVMAANNIDEKTAIQALKDAKKLK